jgi:2-iminobutanoate/2-iminopropanoate deaminase
MEKVIETKLAPQAIGPYSQARLSGSYLFSSGQIPIDPQTGALVQGGIEVQVKQVMENLKQVLIAAGLGFDQVIKTTVFITKMDDFNVVNKIYGSYFANNKPARSCVAVTSLPKGALLEIELIAVNPIA